MVSSLPALPSDFPEPARIVLDRWREAHAADGIVPDIAAFAPFRLPPAVIPWTTTLRRTGPATLEYRIVGEELTFLYGSNPRGRQVLDYAPANFRSLRYTMILRAMDEGTPFWFRGDMLFVNLSVRFGRLGLPMRGADGQALIVVYFPIGTFPYPRPAYIRSAELAPEDVVWLDAGAHPPAV